MSFVKNVTEQTVFTTAISKPSLTVVDFTASWCPPCQAIKPVFANLSAKYRDAEFLQLDVDALKDVAQACGISAMPTFQFYKSGKKIDEIKGANPQGLEAMIVKNLAGSTGAASSSSGSPITVAGHSDLSDVILKKQLDALNINSKGKMENIFLKNKSFIESDCDEQLILSVPFNQAVKLHSIKILAPKEKAPKTIKMFINLPHTPSFEEAESLNPVETLVLSEADYREESTINLRFVKYQCVHSVQMFIVDNLGGGDVSAIEQLIFIGTPVATTNMSDLKKVDHQH